MSFSEGVSPRRGQSLRNAKIQTADYPDNLYPLSIINMKKELRKRIGIKKLKQQGLSYEEIGKVIREYKKKFITN